jgi:hypothetical protein
MLTAIRAAMLIASPARPDMLRLLNACPMTLPERQPATYSKPPAPKIRPKFSRRHGFSA